ncbi:hypothetical protein [Vibrio crassostreae]|uniref:hypothetical protein n=1 Tax=Vibrio crassostreae TaxID=246167 RepID=UPI000F4EB608|nr:hypothetical protein [Vibrio crassostreae]
MKPLLCPSDPKRTSSILTVIPLIFLLWQLQCGMSVLPVMLFVVFTVPASYSSLSVFEWNLKAIISSTRLV